jgi:hypothetical protein
VLHYLEQGIAHQVRDVSLAAGKVVVDAKDVVAAIQQLLAQMRADEPGASGDQNFHCPRLVRPT